MNRNEKGEKVILGKEKIDQVDCFTYLGNNISKYGGCIEDVKSRITGSQSSLFIIVENKLGK